MPLVWLINKEPFLDIKYHHSGWMFLSKPIWSCKLCTEMVKMYEASRPSMFVHFDLYQTSSQKCVQELCSDSKCRSMHTIILSHSNKVIWCESLLCKSQSIVLCFWIYWTPVMPTKPWFSKKCFLIAQDTQINHCYPLIPLWLKNKPKLTITWQMLFRMVNIENKALGQTPNNVCGSVMSYATKAYDFNVTTDATESENCHLGDDAGVSTYAGDSIITVKYEHPTPTPTEPAGTMFHRQSTDRCKRCFFFSGVFTTDV